MIRTISLVGIWISLLMLLAFMLTGATTTRESLHKGCQSWRITSTANDYYQPLGGVCARIELEPDTTGAGIGTQTDLFTCTEENPDTCEYHYWDSDDDGARDTHTLTGVGWPLQQRSTTICGAAYVLVDAVAYSNPAQISFCKVE